MTEINERLDQVEKKITQMDKQLNDIASGLSLKNEKPTVAQTTGIVGIQLNNSRIRSLFYQSKLYEQEKADF